MKWLGRGVVAASGLVASVGVLLFTYQLLLGCAGGAARSGGLLGGDQARAPSLREVPPELADLLVFFDAEGVSKPEFRNAIKTGLTGALLRAGMRPTTEAARADVRIRATGDEAMLFEVLFDGLVIGQSQTTCSANLDWGKWEQCVATELVNNLVANGRVVAVGAARSVRRPVVVAAAAAPPVPPAPIAEPAPAVKTARTSAWITGIPQPDAWALVVGIERYRDVPAATGARADAEQVAALLRQTLGVPESHLIVALDERASHGDIEKHLRWLRSNAQPGGRVYFYFSGHGAPDPSTGASYLVPYDGDPRFLGDTALPMKDVIKSLSDTGARDVLAIVDSCFSGAGGRSLLPPGARPLVMQKAVKPAPHVALLSASSGAEISGPTADQKAGLFTQVLLQALGTGKADLDGDGQISLRELLDWIKPRVARDARRENREQHPNLVVGDDVGDGTFVVVRGLGGN